MMYMSEVRLLRAKLRERMSACGGVHGGNLYDAHQMLWRLFADAPDRRRDFLFCETAPGAYITVSARSPEDRDGIWDIRVKPYAPVLRQGERLAFFLRANAVIKRTDATGRQQRHDIVQDARKRLMAEGVAPAALPSRQELAQREGCNWLRRREKLLGLKCEEASLQVSERIVGAFRKRRTAATVAMFDLQGRAYVTDVDALLRTLFKGVGPSKSFGCGLLLVRRDCA